MEYWLQQPSNIMKKIRLSNYVGVKALITLAVVITKKINTCILNFENSSMLFEF